MPDLKPAVAITSATVENMSRHNMLEWVNSTVHGQYKKIEELCSGKCYHYSYTYILTCTRTYIHTYVLCANYSFSIFFLGVAYCQMMELLFPNSVVYKRIKCNAKLEHEFLHNLKLFQAAFTKANIDKAVPIDRLVKGKFQDNFEFLQWFKKFFDSQSVGRENLKVPSAVAAAIQNPPKPIRKLPTQTSDVAGITAKATTAKTDKLKTPKNDKQQEERTISPSSLKVLKETQEQLAVQMVNIELERNTYYKKLAAIETM